MKFLLPGLVALVVIFTLLFWYVVVWNSPGHLGIGILFGVSCLWVLYVFRAIEKSEPPSNAEKEKT